MSHGQSDEVRLVSPFPEWAVPRIWQWIGAFRDRVADDYSPQTLDEFVAHWERTGARQKTWAVYRGEELGGVIQSTSITPWLSEAHCTFKKTFWGSSTTATALRIAAEELFASGVEKIVSMPFRDNKALLGLTRSLGFRKEGQLEGQTRRDGKPVDVVVIGLRKEWFVNARNSIQHVDGRGPGIRVRESEPEHEHHSEHQQQHQRNVDHNAEPQPVSVGDVIPPVKPHHQPDTESTIVRGAVPDGGAQLGQQQLQRVS